MDAIGGVSMGMAAMQDPVNQAMMKAVGDTMAMETGMMQAGVAAQVGGVEAATTEQAVGQLLNEWA